MSDLRRLCLVSLATGITITALAWPARAFTAPRAPAARVVSCRNTHLVYGLIFVTSARNMSCAAAVREQRTTEHGSLRRTKHGFRCGPLDRNRDHWRCARGSQAYRWEYGL
jgi:hypothetical protein